MFLRGSIARLLTCSPSSCEPAYTAVLRRSATVVPSAWFSTEMPPAKRYMADKQELLVLPRPPEIPFQPEVSNSIYLAGSVGVPVQLRLTADGSSAVSALVRKKSKDSPQFWIPVIFHGDLAIAACNLKENDLVYIAGKLCMGTNPMKTENAQAHVQVLAHTLHFIQQSEEGKLKKLEKERLWSDLVANPQQCYDNRENKQNGMVINR